ncbi:FAD-dependent oxidoreductase [Chryseolinea sp. T2]|uniref:NAD(P)/FAD-dependent oxidoreductase n=1 Tax=Chryseolinea sp. T2 TaxID=3129255 RepID=UPI0030788A92
MRVRSCETYWLLKNGLINSYPSLRSNLACDVLVIGGGITGSLMAWQFATEGYNTVLIDRNDVSLGSTSATTALLQYEIDMSLTDLTQKVGQEQARDCYRGGVEAILKLEKIVRDRRIACEFERRRSIYVAHNRKQSEALKAELASRKSAGIDVEWIDQKDLLGTYGVHGFGAIRSAVAACVDGYCLAHALLDDAATNHSLRIYDHTEIEAIAYQSSGNDVHVKGGWHISTSKIVFATGYETLSFLKDNVADLISTYACVSEPFDIPAPLRENIFWNTDDPYLYLRSTPDNRLLVGGADVPFKNALRRDALIDRKELALIEQLKIFVPGLSIIPDFTWAGTFGVTKDALPYIGAHHDYPNSFFVLGFGGNGITFSIMAMQILSDAMAGRENKFLHYFRFGR